MKEKLLDIRFKFKPEDQANSFCSVIADCDYYDTDYSLFGSIYMGDNNEPYIEIPTNRLSELVVPQTISMGHLRLSDNMTTYKVSVFWINNRLFVVEGYTKNGRSVGDDMGSYISLFTATYNGKTRKWEIPLCDIVNTFNHETPISLGVYKNLGNHIRKLCQIFEW